jgi:hypothetical protein
MTRASVQYALTIDGCPYAAASPACSTSITSGGEWPSGVTVVPGSLSRDTRMAWSESIKPITGETSVSGLSFLLDDVIATSGDASGERLWTWLFSRRPRYIDSAALSASITDASTSIVVTRDPGFGSGAQVIWIDREAILCSGFNAGTLTFTASTRGYLGTRAAAHAIDTANAFTPVVWGDWPGPVRRRVILWKIEGTTATPIWRGYCGRAPRLADNGAQWELQADHAITAQLARSLGPAEQSTRLVGFDPNAFALTIMQVGFAGSTVRHFNVFREPYTGQTPLVLEDALSIVHAAMQAQLTALGSGFNAFVTLSVAGDSQPRADSRANRRHQLMFNNRGLRAYSARPANTDIDPSETFDCEEVASNVFTHRRTFGYPVRALLALENGVAKTYPVDNISGIPTSALSASYVDGSVSTRVQWAVQGIDSSDLPFHIPLESVDTSNKTITGRMRRSTANARAVMGVEAQGDVLVAKPTPIQLITVVESGHWLRAIQRGVLATEYGVTDQADPRDWSFGNAASVIASTGGDVTTSRVWVFDGSQTVGDFLRDTCRLDGCAIGLYGSQLRIVALDAVLPTETPALAIDLTAGQGLHRKPPSFSTLPDGIVNVVKITPAEETRPSITVNNQSSIAMWGQAPAVEIEAKGAIATMLVDKTPFELARGPLIRILGLWGLPSEVITVEVPHAYLTSVELGDVVSVTSKIVPDGAGHRGIATTRYGRVYSREIDLIGGVLKLQILVSGADQVAGYAPAIRVQTISGAGNKQVDATLTYLLEVPLVVGDEFASDYAGSNLSGYSGTANDGGVSRFAVGDVVRFVRRDTTTDETEGGFVIDSVSSGSSPPFVTITPDPALGAYDWPSKVAAGEMIDLTADHYTSVVATQQRYAYIGDATTEELGSDPLKEWAP